MKWFKFIWQHFLMKMRDQRGEIGEVDDDPPEKKEDQETDDDDFLTNLILDDEDDSEKESDKEAEDEKETDKDEEKEKPPADKGEKSVETLEQEIARLKKDKTDLKIALSQERKAKKKAKGEETETVFTDDQILAIMEDNKDDHKTMLRIIKYQAEQAAKGHAKSAVDSVEIKARQKEIDGMLSKNFPTLSEEGSPVREQVDKAKEYFGLEDHPHGDLFALGAQLVALYPDLMAQAEERGKNAALGIKADKNREKDLDKKSPAFKKGKSSEKSELTAQQAQTAKQLGLKGNALRDYKRLVGNKHRSVSMED